MEQNLHFKIFYLNILMKIFIMMLSHLKFIHKQWFKKKNDRLNLEHCCLSLQREVHVTLSVLIEDRIKHDITF